MLKDALLRICFEDEGSSLAQELYWLVGLISRKGVNGAGIVASNDVQLDVSSVLSCFTWFFLYVRDGGIRMDQIAVTIGYAIQRLKKVLVEMGVDLSYLNLNGELDTQSYDIEVRAFRSNPNRWDGVIIPAQPRDCSHAVSIKRVGVMVSYIGYNYRWAKHTINGFQCYDMDSDSDWGPTWGVNDALLVGYGDVGIAYILANGYPHALLRPSRYHSDYSIFITQAALWMYLAEIGCCRPLSNRFLHDDPDDENLRPIIRRLAEGALRAKRSSKSSGKGVATISGKKYYAKVFSSQSMRAAARYVALMPV